MAGPDRERPRLAQGATRLSALAAMTTGRGPLRALSALCILALAAPLFWMQLTFVLSERALARGPLEALAWNPHRAEFLASAAELAADQAKTEADREKARRLARRALLAGPLENRGLLVLALDADRRGLQPAAAAMMTALGARTFRNIQVQLWLAQNTLLAQDYPAGFLHLDAAMRREPALSRVAYPVLAVALQDPAAVKPMADRLRAGPAWRETFLPWLVRQDGVAPEAEALFMALRGGPGSATEPEVEGLVTLLLASDDPQTAHAAWLKFLPAGAGRESGAPYDGGFRGLPGAPPFNWRLASDDGVTADLERAMDGRPALHVQYSVARRHVLAEQLLLLPPGAYRLAGEGLVEAGEAPARLSWRVSCAGGDGAFVEAPLVGAQGGWRAFSAAIDIPSTGCAAQQLRLVNDGQDSFATADAWVSQLRIEPR